jgi:L-lactate dehydrogenase complex protein LldG
MMNPRDAILHSIRANRPAGRHDRPELPDFPMAEPDAPAARFARNLKQMGGQVLDHGSHADPLAAVRQRLAGGGVICSATSEVAGNRTLAAIAHPRELADVDVAVVRAAIGVAETGSVLLTERELQENALAYLAQHLVVLLDPADIVSSIQDAYRRPELHEARYAVFHTGPSATADIEGVLIHGAQGVRSLTVVLVPRMIGRQPPT